MNDNTIWIDVPAPQLVMVEVDGKQERQPVDFKRFAIEAWLSDLRWGVSDKHLAACIDTRKRIIESNGKIELPKPAWALLCEIASKPALPYDPRCAEGYLTFIGAVLDAKPKASAYEPVPEFED